MLQVSQWNNAIVLSTRAANAYPTAAMREMHSTKLLLWNLVHLNLCMQQLGTVSWSSQQLPLGTSLTTCHLPQGRQRIPNPSLSGVAPQGHRARPVLAEACPQVGGRPGGAADRLQ